MDINQIPHRVLHRMGAKSAVIRAAGEDYFTGEPQARVLVGTNPSSIVDIEPGTLTWDTDAGVDLSALEERRQGEGVYSITLSIAQLDADLMRVATQHLHGQDRVLTQLETLEERTGRAYVVYAVTHYNPRGRPLGPLTVNIGGDCFRTGQQIKDLSSVLDRTKDLSEAMLKKAVMIFPDIPTLHGGKKGEWIVLDEKGQKITELSDEAIIALGSAIIPKGIRFLNKYKEKQAIEAKVFEKFPDRNYIRPDSGSPDVLSGRYWRGEDPGINMCEAWDLRKIDMGYFTCLPNHLGGTIDGSARPTGFGVAISTMELARRKYPDRSLKDLRYLLEAAGKVGRSTIETLKSEYGVPKENITVFDKSAEACRQVKQKYGVRTISLHHDDFYRMRLREDRQERNMAYDIWINNGEGNNSKPDHIQELLAAGVRVFTGGANNFLEVATEEESRELIFKNGGWAWPDAVTSGGGWTLAVSDIMTRCQGRKSNTERIQNDILKTIASRNKNLVNEVLEDLPAGTNGREIWNKVEYVIEGRIRVTLSLDLKPEDLLKMADTTRWSLA